MMMIESKTMFLQHIRLHSNPIRSIPFVPTQPDSMLRFLIDEGSFSQNDSIHSGEYSSRGRYGNCLFGFQIGLESLSFEQVLVLFLGKVQRVATGNKSRPKHSINRSIEHSINQSIDLSFFLFFDSNGECASYHGTSFERE